MNRPVRWYRINKMLTNAGIPPIQRKSIWCTLSDRLYLGPHAIEYMERHNIQDNMINIHRSCICGQQLNREHILFECPYAKCPYQARSGGGDVRVKGSHHFCVVTLHPSHHHRLCAPPPSHHLLWPPPHPNPTPSQHNRLIYIT